MNVVTSNAFSQESPAAILCPMADDTRVRVFVKLTPEWKRRLDVLAAAKQVKSNEVYAGDLLTRAIESEEGSVGRFTPASAPRRPRK